MVRTIGHVTVVVRDYDEAIRFWVDKVGLRLIEDTPIPEQKKRWVLVGPADSHSPALLLARAVTDEQRSRIGDQTGGRVFLFLLACQCVKYISFQAHPLPECSTGCIHRGNYLILQPPRRCVNNFARLIVTHV